MNDFDDRRRAFEDKFAHDAELRFKVSARRNKMLGEWAAKQLGIQAQHEDEYVKAVVMSDLAEPGDDDVMRKVLADFKDAGKQMDERTLREKMNALMADAMDEVAG